MSGRLLEARDCSTVRRKVTVSPGRTGFGQRMLSTPGAPMLIALAGGEVQLSFATSITAMAFIKQNRVKVLATASKRRLPYLPEVPTLEEAGLKGFEVAPWQGLLGPAGLRRPIVDQIYTEVAKLLRLPDVRERLAATGSDPVGSTPAEFAAQIKRELRQYGKVIKAAGIKAE